MSQRWLTMLFPKMDMPARNVPFMGSRQVEVAITHLL